MKYSIWIWNSYLIFWAHPPLFSFFTRVNSTHTFWIKYSLHTSCIYCRPWDMKMWYNVFSFGVCLPLLTGYQSRVAESQTVYEDADSASWDCVILGWGPFRKKITMSLWLICIAIEPIVFYGIDWPIPAERVIKIRLKKQLAAECPAIKISLFKRLLFLFFFCLLLGFFISPFFCLCVSLSLFLFPALSIYQLSAWPHLS